MGQNHISREAQIVVSNTYLFTLRNFRGADFQIL